MTKCTRCKWHDNELGINCTPFFGNPNADIIFAGEAFGKTEAEVYSKFGVEGGGAFIGKTGFKFNGLLDYAKLKREDVAVLNVLRCYQKGNPTPTNNELNTCFIYTYRDIKKIKPKLIVAMGRSALYSLAEKETVTPYIGKLLYSEKIKCNIFVTNHPASCLHDPDKWSSLVKEFKKIPSLLESKPFEVYHTDYTLVTTKDQFKKMYKALINLPYMTFDMETWGLDSYDKLLDIRCLQLGVSEEEIYVLPLDSILKYKEALKVLFKIVPVIGQDFAFDVKWLYNRLGISIDKWKWDTCLAEYILTGMKDNDLTYLTAKYNPKMVGYDDEVVKAGGAHKIFNESKLQQYAADDVCTLFPIFEGQRKELEKEKRLWVCKNLTFPCNEVLTDMSLTGVKYDLSLIDKVDREYEEKANKLLEKAIQLPGIKETENHFRKQFNPRSSHHLKWLLLEYYQLPILKKTENDTPSIGIKEMEAYSRGKFKNPYCKTMVRYRSIQQIRKNFLSGIVPKLHEGIAHTTYSLHTTATGRPTSSDPNLLNIPTESNIKKCIVPREGCVFIYSDLAQIEVRVASVIYEDENLLEVCNSGGDFHSMITSRVRKMDYVEFFDLYKAGDKKITELRRKGKTTTFGIMYGQGARGLAYELGIKEWEAQSFINEYFNEYHGLKKGIDKAIEHVIKYGYIDTYFGFRRWWKKHSIKDVATHREAQNHPIQGTSWGIMQLILIQVKEMLKRFESRLVMQIYDALVIETPVHEVSDVAHLVRNIIENINKPYERLNRVKIVADIKTGYNLDEEKMTTYKF